MSSSVIISGEILLASIRSNVDQRVDVERYKVHARVTSTMVYHGLDGVIVVISSTSTSGTDVVLS